MMSFYCRGLNIFADNFIFRFAACASFAGYSNLANRELKGGADARTALTDLPRMYR